MDRPLKTVTGLRQLQEGADSPNLSIRCPVCQHMGSFPTLTSEAFDVTGVRHGGETVNMGQRLCPNLECRALIFVAYDPYSSAAFLTYPAQTLDFDATNLPEVVLASLEEAVICHSSGCFVACAIMVRKTLETVCHDRGATGANLKIRLEALRAHAVLPPALLEGLQDLRLLGNDAAHIESQTYEHVGREEVELALEITKEVLKGVYQYSALLDKLAARRRETESSSN